MPAALVPESPDLGDGRAVAGVEMRRCGPDPDGPRAYVERTPGHATGCPRRGATRGACDTRGRTWRRPGIWQHETHARRGLPRLGRDEGGPPGAGVPWADPDARHLAALLGTQVPAVAMSPVPAGGMAGPVRGHDARAWATPGGIVAEAHAEADLSGAGDVGVDETARRRGHDHPASLAGPGGERAVVCALGRDAGTVAGLARELAERGGDPGAAGVAARDLSPALPRGVPGRPPDAERVAGRSRVTRLATRQPGGVRRGKGVEGEEGAPRQDQARMAGEGGEPYGGAGREEAHAVEGAPRDRPRLRDEGGAAGGLRLRGRGRRGVGAGRPARPGHAPGRPPDEDGRQDRTGARGRDPGPLRPQARQRRPRGNELGSPVGQEAGTRAR
ncbi:hypothetical protein ADJ70_13345 [Olsenella sp. oral taxon 807]|nr:hypothetical protein ADJ70_13345 [Olsenella sp. oral taxon 807]